MKRIINLIIVFLALFTIAQGADMYQIYKPSFSMETPSSLYVAGAECIDNSCTGVNSNSVELFNGNEFADCWNAYLNDNDENKFITCVDNAKINGNIINLSQMSLIAIKENTDANFGSIEEFFASNDSYLPMYSRNTDYNCNYDICVDSDVKSLNFEKKSDAIAEIGQLNIENTNNKLLPVQVEIPVKIDETVCSAFRFVDSNMYRFAPPEGYSDFSADTLINLRISNNETGYNYFDQSVTIPIEADQCAGLGVFKWTPSSDLENISVKFAVETDVIDNQVSSSIKDYASDIETIYPINLDNTCWTRAYDFTLSNIDSFDLTSSVAQITKGETLFANFRAIALRDNSLTPMDFRVRIKFNDSVVYDKIEESSSDLMDFSVNLSSQILNLPAGTYNVTLIVDPVGDSCLLSKSVVQFQKLELLKTQYNKIYFHVKNSDGNFINLANINLTSESFDDYYQNYNEIQKTTKTDENGLASIDELKSGIYKYSVSKEGYTSVTNEIHIASNMDVYIVLPKNNTAPVINLPDSVTANYNKVIKLDLKNYVRDFNDGFDKLNIEGNVINGNFKFDITKNGELDLYTNEPTSGVIEIKVIDPFGAISIDRMNVIFVSNSAPVINSFYATPDNGETPLNVSFNINVTDADNDSLNCALDFGDGSFLNESCDNLKNINHIYNKVGSYNPVLIVNDGSNPSVKMDDWVYVTSKMIIPPLVNTFKMTSSNGYILPTNISLYWLVTSPTGENITCTLEINGVNNSIPCDGEYHINNFNVTGVSNFKLIAVDEDGTTATRLISKEFFKKAEEVNLSLSNTDLIIDSEIVPGEFNFQIKTMDEKLAERTIKVAPFIVCEGAVNTLNTPSGYLSTMAVSEKDGKTNVFNLKTSTNDFNLIVPTNIQCEFKVRLTDEFGSNLVLSKNVMFKYPDKTHYIQSIRGKATDIMDYMSTALSGNIVKGYNTLEFEVTNNDEKEKTLVISISSQELNMFSNKEINLGQGQTKDIKIPLLIKKDTKAGMYPLRFSVYDGSDKQVRYTYLRVGN